MSNSLHVPRITLSGTLFTVGLFAMSPTSAQPETRRTPPVTVIPGGPVQGNPLPGGPLSGDAAPSAPIEPVNPIPPSETTVIKPQTTVPSEPPIDTRAREREMLRLPGPR